MAGQQRVAIVTDSVACLPPDTVRRYGVRVVPLNLCFEGRVYREGVDLTAAEAYQMLARAPDRFATSPGSAGDYLEVYRELAARYPAICCVTISSKLSTIYNMACVARQQVRGEFPELVIEVLDSTTAAAGEMLVVLAAARAAATGSEIADVAEAAGAVGKKVTTIGVFETIRHVYRTGRVPRLATRMLSALNIKPLFSISGELHITSVDTSKGRGLRRLIDRMRERVGTGPVHVAISHANVPDEGERLRRQVQAEFDCSELILTDFSPVMGYATGEGTLVIAFYGEEA